MDYMPYLRKDKFPHIWCEGCGDGIALKAILRAVDNLKWEKDKIAMVSGIGCSSRTPGYVDFNTLHTTHGRAIAFATGLKMARSDLNVIVVTGDGDATAIGGNHLIHAARRNINLTVLVYNNFIYGMTGGQVSPTTPMGDFATTAPYGGLENTFDIAGLTIAAGASYVARASVYHAKMLERLIERALEKKGFSLVEIMSPCPTAYGKINKKGRAKEIILDQKYQAVRVEKAKTMEPQELQGKFITGILIDRDLPEYIQTYDKVIAQAQSR
ncbi:2-oxoacid:ferredoxin oxidoreductase subunit beta [Calditrichota bacterium]